MEPSIWGPGVGGGPGRALLVALPTASGLARRQIHLSPTQPTF